MPDRGPMPHDHSSSVRAQQLLERLREVDEAIARTNGLTSRRRAALTELQAQRRKIANELTTIRASAKGELVSRILAHFESGMPTREIAKELKQSRAVVSRVIEKAKAAERKKKSASRRCQQASQGTQP
jgi:hypothetical protein